MIMISQITHVYTTWACCQRKMAAFHEASNFGNSIERIFGLQVCVLVSFHLNFCINFASYRNTIWMLHVLRFCSNCRGSAFLFHVCLSLSFYLSLSFPHQTDITAGLPSTLKTEIWCWSDTKTDSASLCLLPQSAIFNPAGVSRIL